MDDGSIPLFFKHFPSSFSVLSLHLLRYEFFNELYHRFLLTPKVTMKCLCLQALTIVYGKCCEEIGPFTDTKYIVGMLDRVSTSIQYINYLFVLIYFGQGLFMPLFRTGL